MPVVPFAFGLVEVFIAQHELVPDGDLMGRQAVGGDQGAAREMGWRAQVVQVFVGEDDDLNVLKPQAASPRQASRWGKLAGRPVSIKAFRRLPRIR